MTGVIDGIRTVIDVQACDSDADAWDMIDSIISTPDVRDEAYARRDAEDMRSEGIVGWDMRGLVDAVRR